MYLCSYPQHRGCNAETWGAEERRVGQVEGEEDRVPEKVLLSKEEISQGPKYEC